MNGSYQLLKFLSRVCCRLSDRSAVKMGHILGEFFWMLIPNRRKKLALQNIFRGNITKDVKTAERHKILCLFRRFYLFRTLSLFAVEHVLGKEYRGEKRVSRKPLKFGKN